MLDPENNPTTIAKYPLEKRKVIKRFIASEVGKLILWAIVSAILAFVMMLPQLAGMALMAFVAITVLLVIYTIVNWWYQNKYYERYYYDIRKNFLVIKKGVFMPRETTLPFDKMQDVYMDQDIWDRIFSLWDLHVSTATILSGFNAHIDGVNKENAEAMREMLMKQIKANK